MATYKISLLGLFLIILGALVVSILVGNWFQTREGMVSFQYGVSPLKTVNIPKYTDSNVGKNVSLVFDNIYFDTDNSNLLEINGNAYTGNTYTGNADLIGNSINSINISSHSDNNNNKTISTVTWNTKDQPSILEGESKRVFKKSYYEYDYITTTTNTDNYQVFVLPWNDSTYIHVINLTKKTNVITACFGPNGANNSSQSKLYDGESSKLPFQSNTAITEIGRYINTYLENSNMFVLNGHAAFDDKKKILIIFPEPESPKIELYNQQGKQILSTQYNSQAVSKTIFNPYITYDKLGNKMILTITNASKTLIAVIEPNPSENNYRLFNVKRFDFVELDAIEKYGVDPGPKVGDYYASKFDYKKPNISTNPAPTTTSNPIIPKSDPTTTSSSTPNTTIGSAPTTTTSSTTPKNSPDMMNDYYRWFYYWATQGLNNNPNSPGFNYSDDYIMKTQIVPPVCPSCPSCPAIGTCTNCGGKGGSGTQTTDGNSYLKDVGDYAKNAVGSAQDKAKGVIMGTEDNVRDLITGTRDQVNLAAGSTVNIAKDTVSGAVGLGKDIVGGTVGLGREIVGGTVGLGKDIVGGIANLGRDQNNDVDRSGYSNSYGGSGSGSGSNQLLPKNNSSVVDQSNLYGAMPNKGKSNYMPLGSDFSKFGR